MSASNPLPLRLSTLADRYERDGFVFPVEVLGVDEVGVLREDLERAEAELEGDPERLGLLRSYPDRLLPSFDKLIRHPRLIEAATQLLGPDLMVWSASMFMKEAHSSHVVSWHQDLTYWGLNAADEVTAWLALSPATLESGCMKFIPGSHKRSGVAHVDTFAADNLLTRGQEVAVDVNEQDAMFAPLRPGEASLHHGYVFHASEPNNSNDRRLGTAIRYIKPSMQQRTGDKPLAALVSGKDQHDNFTVAGPPQARLAEKDFELCRRDAEIKRRVLYANAENAAGKRY